MQSYVLLLRGINVGGKNKIPMAALKTCLERCGFTNVQTYIASGNVLVDSSETAATVKTVVELAIVEQFALDSALIKVLVLTAKQLQYIVDHKPTGFGESPALFHSDVIFLIDTTVHDVMPLFRIREGVDTVWPGEGVVYSQRLSAERTKSQLNKIMTSPLYKSMTIRTWNTTTTLLSLLSQRSVHN